MTLLLTMPAAALSSKDADHAYPIHKDNCGLYDVEGNLPEDEAAELTQKIRDTAEELQMYVAVVIVGEETPFSGDSAVERYADDAYDELFNQEYGVNTDGVLLVVNNSKVLPARIVGIKQPTGAVCELLLLRQVKGDQWECLAKPGKRMQPGTKVSFGDGSLTAIVDETLEDGNKFVTFYYDTETLYEKLDEFGKMPLPPYITKQLDDQSQYQTVYAKELGSAAAPTAGLHFTPELMDTIRAKGVNITEVTLHVGLGTFRPVQEDEIADHKMHSEWYSVSEETAKLIHDTKAAGHRVIAVGTTSCRTLEAVAAKYGEIKACSGNTDIFLYPGVKFNCIDGLITNFHLPESTLIMLVSALYGYEKTMAAYKVAVEQKYRFFSFGDAMLIL